MAKENKTETIKIEREYVIPLREKCRVSPRYKKTPKAIRVIKEFIIRHMKVYDRDLNKVKIDKYLNEFLWDRGIRNPPHKIKIKAIKEGEIVKVELVEMPKKLKFKKTKEEKREKAGEEISKKKKEDKKEEKPEEVNKEEVKEEEKKKEETEKKSAVVEAGNEMEKAASKQAKRIDNTKIKELKHHFRQSMKK